MLRIDINTMQVSELVKTERLNYYYNNKTLEIIRDENGALSLFTHEIIQGKHTLTKRSLESLIDQLQLTGKGERVKKLFDSILEANKQLIKDKIAMLERQEL